ncbi:MAG: hypothetical protein JWR26_3590 [Pedosphaera sp.]|nr:hypothetical protein [Pedosphaera sp.]
MNRMVPLLAQMEMLDVGAAQGHFRFSLLPQILLIVGAIILIVGLIFIWAIFFRKPARRRRKHHKHRKHPPKTDSKSAEAAIKKAPAAVVESNKGKKRRRSRHERLPRNPTLAETKGLPPIREEQSTLPPPY